MSARPVLRVWYDFLCPFARIGTFWLRNVQAAGGLDHDIEWNAFSLEQINLEPGADPDELWASADRRRGLLPLAAAKWADGKGPDVFEVVQRAFFDANHVDRKKIGKPEVASEVLDGAGLDGATILEEITTNRSYLEAARADCAQAATLGIFGVPTLVFPDARPLFVRLLEVPDGDRAVAIYANVRTTALDPVIDEMKRAR